MLLQQLRARHTTSQWLLQQCDATSTLMHDQDQKVAVQHDIANLHMLQFITKTVVLGTTVDRVTEQNHLQTKPVHHGSNIDSLNAASNARRHPSGCVKS